MQDLKSLIRIAKNVIKRTPKEKKVSTLKNIGFFNPSLKYNFLKLRLYHNVNIFVN